MKNLIRIICLLCLFLLNCSFLFSARTPIDSIHYLTGKDKSKSLLIMLPGRSEKTDAFIKHGFIQRLKDTGTGFDAVVVDAHLGYYYKENLVVRLYEDIVKPAKLNGYETIWILGVSMGGLGALWYGKDKGETINGIIAIAPFVGDKDVIDEIKASGGPAKWTPKEAIAKGDYQRGLWVWLRNYSLENKNLPKLILGYGMEDEFAYGDDLLAQMLPNDRLFTLSGGHDWDTWTRLFDAILNLGKLSSK
ncbi:MAG: alpha/beta hydrolase-fold protein [Spirochaetota bacterium]